MPVLMAILKVVSAFFKPHKKKKQVSSKILADMLNHRIVVILLENLANYGLPYVHAYGMNAQCSMYFTIKYKYYTIASPNKL